MRDSSQEGFSGNLAGEPLSVVRQSSSPPARQLHLLSKHPSSVSYLISSVGRVGEGLE